MTTKEKAVALHLEGFTEAEIALKLGVAKSTAHYHVTGRGNDCLNRESFLAWLDSMTHTLAELSDNNQALTVINGQPMAHHTDSRTYYAWRRENRGVTLYQADRFSCSIGVPLQHFFIWCHFNDRNPWQGKPPSYEAPIDDVPERLCKSLKWHLRMGTPFKEAWRLAVQYAQPHESWNHVVSGGENYYHPRETRPINFARRVFKEVYEEVLGQDEERLAA